MSDVDLNEIYILCNYTLRPAQLKTSDGAASDKEESVIMTAGGYQIREQERISDSIVRGQWVQK